MLEDGGVKARYGGKTAYIVNRTKTGMCPMETFGAGCGIPEEGVKRLNEFLTAELEERNGTEKNENTGEMVSLLGLGWVRFPHKTPGSDDIDEERAAKMIDDAIHNGINYFDTAYPYHGQMSEPSWAGS